MGDGTRVGKPHKPKPRTHSRISKGLMEMVWEVGMAIGRVVESSKTNGEKALGKKMD